MSSRRSATLRSARVLAFALATACTGLGSAPAAAQDTAAAPCRTATLVVAGGAGSGTDLIARAVAEAANANGIKPPLKVRNIDGANGVDGARAVLRAPGDGCMMLIAHQGLLANFLTWKAPFAWHDFRHVALLTRTPMVLVSPVAAPFETAAAMAATADTRPVVAAVGPGTVAEFALRGMAKAMEVELEYDAILGAHERVIALLEGDIDVTSVPSALALRLRETLLVRPIAVTDRSPSNLLPSVATLRDQGIPFDYAIDIGILLPRSATPDLASQLAGDLEKALDDPTLQQTLAEYDVRIDFRPLTQYTIYWENLMATWREIAVEAGYDRSSR